MSKFSKLGLRRAAGACAITAAAAIGLASMGTGNAAAAPLANGSKVVTGLEGESIKTTRTGESQFSVARVANNGLGRTALLSGVYTATGSDGVNGKLTVYVLAGCQIDVSGFSATTGGSLTVLPAPPSVTLSGGVSLPIAPGESAIQAVSVSKSFKAGKGAAVQLSNFEISFPNCGGYASARTITKVWGGKGYDISDDDDTVTGEGTFLQSSLYGQPFFVS
ncbi:MspA family porin [Gordonia polyisoprenivorans]|uniref:MspA family porin n=1 Tax=Gordonia polyisoprenivorans TaxID=84595 RepID=UPI001B8BB4BC|nr:MspA family porin [Gordonia polyisoprenivorans]QUD81585.1 MspA family porin [Gordonia polyisoprenivorans]